MIRKPETSEYNPFYETYVSKVASDDMLSVLREQLATVSSFFGALTEAQGEHRYAEGKWSIKEALNHINDIERIFSYRAMCIARGETQSLPGMDQDTYQENSGADRRSLTSLVKEFEAIRHATLCLFEHMSDEDGLKVGEASGSKISVRALAALIAGHALHHQQVTQQKYL